jgi:hypothetical protein
VSKSDPRFYDPKTLWCELDLEKVPGVKIELEGRKIRLAALDAGEAQGLIEVFDTIVCAWLDAHGKPGASAGSTVYPVLLRDGRPTRYVSDTYKGAEYHNKLSTGLK